MAVMKNVPVNPRTVESSKNIPGKNIQDGENAIRLRQTLARGGTMPSDASFGVQSLASTSRGGSYAGQGSMKLADGQRKAGPPISVGQGRRSQAQPDHGPC